MFQDTICRFDRVKRVVYTDLSFGIVVDDMIFFCLSASSTSLSFTFLTVQGSTDRAISPPQQQYCKQSDPFFFCQPKVISSFNIIARTSWCAAARWCSCEDVRLAIRSSRVQIQAISLACNTYGQVVHTHVFLLPTKQYNLGAVMLCS